ncbi:hypothetical protein BCF55_0095 [Hydrogenivirga caldilitoris]|uniref:Zinc-regulated TonB-dependent outer membrane receptor n=1 Tax=Hydrogenivirga caldilitoris TaxID=246264 RepID=A0A497XM21_9AQUI|nr:hypothetical protein [Hydrogenivirga caldilitoris]RLJ69838.1 hypothetical protein BCF55_0095 [Hydrogenivirga caldilitoris]
MKRFFILLCLFSLSFSEEGLKAYQVYPFKQTPFIPNISFLLDTSLVLRNENNLDTLEVPGFLHGHGEEHAHGEFNREKGFNLNYGELFLNAPVDPYFELYVTIPFSEEGVQLEEAYAVTRGLPHGFQVKAGKFRSSFGRLNSQHPHLWDFAQQPLIYRVFFGEGLVEKGVQINWLAPLPLYLLFGLEVLQGENERSFGVKGFTLNTKRDGSGSEVRIGDAFRPGLFVGFLKTSFDLGSLSLLTGLSYALGNVRSIEEEEAFKGKVGIYGVDLTAKYFVDSYTYIALQSEYIHRNTEGTLYRYDEFGDLTALYAEKRQGGFYVQAVWQFSRRWRAGFQYNLITRNEVREADQREDLPDNLPAYYGVLEFRPTEFSRVRFQLGQNRALYEEGERKTINELILQLTFAIGAHGAHPF